jgi:hypothetical protein
MKTLAQLAACLAVAISASGCFGYERGTTPTSPSGSTGSLLGNWSSSSLVPTPTSCADFKWNITEQTGNTAKGSFSATCPGDLKLSGTAQGTINGSNIAWSAEATGSAPGLPSCRVTLRGTAEIGVTTVRVPYSGDTCLGPVSGVESLSRR